ncbi:MAG TPA: YegS/Rv2252/BmrU family lipid kinase, partial [Sedimentibacter sp.]|nr:YegS/Rv2252/BmrU family lipid kinase [Sedimentibacter sp.]
MRHIFIINPIAGNGKLQEKLEESIHLELKDKEIDYEVYTTKSKEDTRNFAENKCRENLPSVLYSCGGDGTLHEIINAAFGYKHVSIGIIPVGSGNDFIKNFTNKANFNDITLQTEGKSLELDLIKANDEYTATVLNIGLDADVAFNMNKFKKIPFIQGPTRYYLSILYSLFSKLGKQIQVKTDNDFINGTFIIGVVANGQYYGGGYKCAPKAQLNDGILDLCFVENISRLKILSLLGSYKKGEHLENPKISKYVTYDKISRAEIKFHGPTNVCMDGDKYIYSEINISTEKNALNFWLPKGVEIISAEYVKSN